MSPISWKRYLLWVLLGLFLIGNVAFGVWYLWTNNKNAIDQYAASNPVVRSLLAPFATPTPIRSSLPTQILFESRIPGYAIDSVNESLLVELLTKLDRYPLNDTPLFGYWPDYATADQHHVFPKTIHVVFYPMSYLGQDKTLNVPVNQVNQEILNGQTMVAFMRPETNSDQTDITLKVYMTPKSYWDREDLRSLGWSTATLKAISFAFQTKIAGDFGGLQTYVHNRIGVLQIPIFIVRKTQSYNLWQMLVNLLVPKAYAFCGYQTCNTLMVIGWRCEGGPYPGFDCNDSIECGSGGTCTDEYVADCTGSQVVVGCSWFGSGGSYFCFPDIPDATAKNCQCNQSMCYIFGSPTPTPTLTPTSTPAAFCGDGSCNGGENCGSCPGDCGNCAGTFCGDGSCNGGETCATCVPDCGSCLPKGTMRARAKIISSSDTSCAAVTGSSSYPVPATFSLSPAIGGPRTQTDANYVSWTSMDAGTYSILGSAPAGYVLLAACWNRNITVPTSGAGISSSFGGGETLTWDLGYSLGSPWVQAQGGDVYAASGVTSAVSTIATPREFVLSGSGGFPGVVTYGVSYDFDPDITVKGETYVSSTNWLANEVFDTTDYYQVFYKRFGAPIAPDTFANLTAVTQPPSRTTPYYVQGDMATSGNWSVGSGEMLVFLVDGDFTINGNINITGTGFVAFIVNGDITVSPSVGNPLATTTPNLEGVYITSTAGTFHSGASSSAGNERLVVEGTVVAGNVMLERDLDSISGNQTTPSELFIYNPQLLITMPDAMRDVPIKWEEVAP